MYILMKRDMRAKVFLLCQICGFMCNYKSIKNWRSRRSKTILNIRTIINDMIIHPHSHCCHYKFWKAGLPICIYQIALAVLSSLGCVVEGTRFLCHSHYLGSLMHLKMLPVFVVYFVHLVLVIAKFRSYNKAQSRNLKSTTSWFHSWFCSVVSFCQVIAKWKLITLNSYKVKCKGIFLSWLSLIMNLNNNWNEMTKLFL